MAIYKQITLEKLEERTSKPISSDKQTKVRSIVSNFITHLKGAS